MNKPWPRVRLGEVLRRSEEAMWPSPEAEYREVTVRLWGKGVVERGRAAGAQLSGRRFIARAGQFIASRIDARNGAMGLVPSSLDGALVTNDFPLFDLNRDRLEPYFLGHLCTTRAFVELCRRASEGTTNRVRLQEERFLDLEIPLPPLSEQRRVVARIEELATHIQEARTLREAQMSEMRQLATDVFWEIAVSAPRRRMHEVAPIVRRPVIVDPDVSYPELGVRSFGRGTFHKPPLSGFDATSKRLYRIEPGDLVLMNVFAWEGAVAVAQPHDSGRCGSHRFITCVPAPGVVTSELLCFYFLTDEGLKRLGDASPGGAGRNRTLGLQSLGAIEVPIPPLKQQLFFRKLMSQVDALKRLQAETAAELDALLPSILDRAFKGEL